MSAGLCLQDRDEVNRIDVGFVLAAFVIVELALVALAGELVDAGLRLPVEAVVDEFASDFGCQDIAQWIE